MIRYIVDSTFGLTDSYIKENKIKVVDLKLILDGVTTDEGPIVNWEEFYLRYKESSNFPSTSQPNAFDYETAINQIITEDNNAEIIILTIASGLSGTLNSARLGAESCITNRVAVIDSQNVSQCCIMLLEQLKSFSDQGGSLDDTVKLATKIIPTLGVEFVPDTMKYLHRGGRIGKVGALIGDIISIKPIFDFRNNVITQPRKSFGMNRGLTDMIKRLPNKIKEICILYIYDDTHVKLLKQKLRKMLNLDDVRVVPVSPVFGIHIGIGTIGLAFQADEE